MTPRGNEFPSLRASGGGVCLNMIVKNEQDVIERCLQSVIPYINSWCIVDTGSTDETKKIIRRTLRHIPGALLGIPWEGDFAKARNYAWDMALWIHHPGRLMFIDADEQLSCPGPVMNWEWDACCIEVLHEKTVGDRYWMVRADYPNRWVGKVHEDIKAHGTVAKIAGFKILSHLDGARGKDKIQRNKDDIAALNAMIAEDLCDSRAWFYLGATLAMAGDYENAADAFSDRIGMGGDEKELARSRSFLENYKAARAELQPQYQGELT